MRRSISVRRSVTALLMTAVAAIPAGCASSTSSPSAPSSSATPTGVAPTPAVSSGAGAGAARTITGPVVDMRWGPVQVTITVKGKRLTNVQASAPMERPRSAFINQQAVPWLRQEALQAQSANIDLISGATMTSEAFAESLQSALNQAHI